MEGRVEDSLIHRTEADRLQKEIDAISVKDDTTEVVDSTPPVEPQTPVGVQIGSEPKAALPKVPDDVRGAPVRQFLYEQASHITQGTRNKEDRLAFLSYVKTGDLPDEVAAKPHVRRWIAELNKATQGRPPAVKDGSEPLFQARNENDQAFVDSVGLNGTTLLERLRRSTDPLVQAAVAKFEKLTDALGRVGVGVHDIDGPSVVRKHSDRTTKIYLSADLRHATPEGQDLVLAHELYHGLTTHMLDQNPAAAQELTLLRHKLARKLPEELRTTIREVEKTGWYESYAAGKAKWDDLVKLAGGSHENAHLVYGLINNDEFISQGYTNKGMKEFMQSKGMFTNFTQWISKLLGLDIKPSDFDAFMNHTDKILGGGDFFASLHNYGERYFENLGLTPEEARSQTSRAIGAVTNLKFGESSANTLIRAIHGQRPTNPVLQQSKARLEEYMQNPPEIQAKALTEAGVTDVDELNNRTYRR